MLIVKLIYLAVMIVSGAFFVLYRDLLALILFIVILTLPILLAVSVFFMRYALSCELTAGDNIIMKGEKGHLTLKLKNRFFLPIIRVSSKAEIRNSFFDLTEVEELSFYVPPMAKRSFDIEVNSEHMGNVSIELKGLRVFDYFGVFSLPLKCGGSYNFQVIPNLSDLNLRLSQNMYTLSESNIFSKHKPGDDPSEVFQIRDYVGGDKLNRIHWKLSTKQSQFMVKDYSLPVSEAVLIAVDLCCDLQNPQSLSLADTVLEAAFSLSAMFVERETVHSLAWYNTRSGNTYTYRIENLDDLYSAFGLIYNSTTFYSEPYMAQLDMECQQNMSHIIYIAPNIGERHLELLSSTRSSTCIFGLLSAITEGEGEALPTSDEFEIFPLISGKTASSLYDLKI